MQSNVSPADLGTFSVFKPLGYQRNNCGYCKTKNGSASYYAKTPFVRPEDYEELIRRGWRRSGDILYKQDLSRSCCPYYTLRLEASEFKIRRDQRKVLNKWNKYILGEEYIRKAARLCPRTKEETRRRKQLFDLSERLHEVEYAHVKKPVDPKTKKPIEPAHKFEVTIESDSFSERKFQLFQKYQQAVHKEDPLKNTKSSFTKFLCSGLKRTTVKENGKEKRIGSYHQMYKLDGELVAVAVLDLLPESVSAVYVFYDPKMEPWGLGKLSALREIALAQEENYKYYAMGFYIHTCVKMRYKGDFRPQYILDPESLTWDPLSELIPYLDKHKYVSMSRERQNSKDAQSPEVSEDTTGPSANPIEFVKDDATPAGQNEDEDDSEYLETSMFNISMPGILRKEDFEGSNPRLDLGKWRIIAQSNLFDLEDLRGWDEWSLTDPQSLKGIFGELAACLGEKVVAKSVVALF